MSDEAKPGKIYTAIPAMIADVGAIAKSQKNESQRFFFRGVDQVYNAVHPLLAKHGVFINTLVESEQREVLTTKSGTSMYRVILMCRFKFHCVDGSFVESLIPGEAMDSGDKATNKALSNAYKYALFQLLCIPTEETAIDGDADSPEDTVQPDDHKPEPPKKQRPKFNDEDGQTKSQREFTARLIMKAATMKAESAAAAFEYAEKSAAELGDVGVKKVREAICERLEKELLAAASKAKYKAEMIDIQTEFMTPFLHLLDEKTELPKMDAICNEIYASLPTGDVA